MQGAMPALAPALTSETNKRYVVQISISKRKKLYAPNIKKKIPIAAERYTNTLK
jgi:hypothetical protein